MLEATHGRDHPLVAKVLNNYALVLGMQVRQVGTSRCSSNETQRVRRPSLVSAGAPVDPPHVMIDFALSDFFSREKTEKPCLC